MEIFLRNGASVLIDDADAHLARFKWRMKRCGYVARSEWREGRAVDFYLHREVLGDQPGMVVDHVNGDRRDNRRSNLRHVSAEGNARNRSKRAASEFKGVSRLKSGKWQARIQGRGAAGYIGSFNNAEQAARAYDAVARALWGEHARLNFPGTP